MIIAGTVMIVIGLFGWACMHFAVGYRITDLTLGLSYISGTFKKLTYLYIFFIILLIAGIIVYAVGVYKKKTRDQLSRIANMGQGGRQKNICPSCGLNLMEGAKECPRCHTVINE